MRSRQEKVSTPTGCTAGVCGYTGRDGGGQPPLPAATLPIEVLLRSGLALRVPDNFDERTLRRLVRVLDQRDEC